MRLRHRRRALIRPIQRGTRTILAIDRAAYEATAGSDAQAQDQAAIQAQIESQAAKLQSIKSQAERALHAVLCTKGQAQIAAKGWRRCCLFGRRLRRRNDVADVRSEGEKTGVGIEERVMVKMEMEDEDASDLVEQTPAQNVQQDINGAKGDPDRFQLTDIAQQALQIIAQRSSAEDRLDYNWEGPL